MAHTPGPFIAWDDGRTIGIEADGEPFAVAEIVDHGDMADEAQLRADQALLAAAPEMLAALKSAVASFEQLVSINRIPANMKGLRDARAAIAKAEGAA